MTMLPFPSIEKVRMMSGPYIQPIPFMIVHDYFRDSGVVISDIKTVIPSLKSGAFLGPAFNIIMLMPMGYFLREIFGCSLKKTSFIAFLTSLFFELTQLSGLFFIYPRPYRIFDVDDLIGNTIGAIIGWLLFPLVKKYSPITNHVKARRLRNGGGVSMRRRIPSILIDQLICVLPDIVIYFIFRPDWFKRYYLFILLFYFCNVLMGLILYFTGTTPGINIMGLKLFNQHKGKKQMWQCICYMLILGTCVSLPVTIARMISLCTYHNIVVRVLIVAINACMILVYIEVIFEFLINAITHGTTMFYDRASRLYLGLNHKKTKSRSQKLILWSGLHENTVSTFSDSVYDYLSELGYKHSAAMRVKLMAEGALKDWLSWGLDGDICTLRFDKRPWCRTILLILICDREIEIDEDAQSYIKIISGLRLSYDMYREGKTIIFSIDVP